MNNLLKDNQRRQWRRQVCGSIHTKDKLGHECSFATSSTYLYGVVGHRCLLCGSVLRLCCFTDNQCTCGYLSLGSASCLLSETIKLNGIWRKTWPFVQWVLSQLYTKSLYWHKGKQSRGNPHCWLAWPRLNWSSQRFSMCLTSVSLHFTSHKKRVRSLHRSLKSHSRKSSQTKLAGCTLIVHLSLRVIAIQQLARAP